MSFAGVLEVSSCGILLLLPTLHMLTTTSGEMLATAGDDGNVLLWVPSENPAHNSNFGDDGLEDVETWRVKTMCRSSSGSEIYDLAWSPDGAFFITGSMDNVARIYNATNGEWTLWKSYRKHWLTACRNYCSTNRRAQPLRAGRCLGSAERICCNTVVRSICTHLHIKDEGRPVHSHSA